MARAVSRAEGQKAIGSKRIKKRKKQRKSSSALDHEAHQKGSKDKKSKRKIPAHVGFQKGDPRINRTIPGPGRPPGRFARHCRKLLANKKTWRAVRSVVQNKNNPAMKSMWTELANRGHGKQQAGFALTLPPTQDQDGNDVPNATFLLIGKLDAMEKRKEKAET